MNKKNKPKRNAPCPCGSNRKYKRCCMPKREKIRSTCEPASYHRFIESLIHEGYTMIKKRRTIECCDRWLQAWERLKALIPDSVTCIDRLADMGAAPCAITTWLRDMDVALAGASLDSEAYAHKRIDFCREVCSRLPDSDRTTIKQLKLGEGLSYYFIGRPDLGYAAYEALKAQFPEIAESEENQRRFYSSRSRPMSSGKFKYN